MEECLEIARGLEGQVDFFLSKAVEEVLHMYGYDKSLREAGFRMFRDTTASGVPVGQLYNGEYHTLVLAPATSNTIAKCVCGISDNLVTNMYAQAGKCRIPTLVFACDTEPVIVTPAPGKEVTVYPRRIDLESAQRLGEFEYTELATSMRELEAGIQRRLTWLSKSSS
jgi:flavoprotein